MSGLPLEILPPTLAITRLPPDAEVPSWAGGTGRFCTISRTAEELSITLEQSMLPESVPAERDFRAVRVRGTLPTDLVGILLSIAGPLAHAFLADLADLPPDDIYAAYAGWQAEHEEIREFDVDRLSKSERLEVERLARRLHDASFAAIEPLVMGYFFGDKALVARATRKCAAPAVYHRSRSYFAHNSIAAAHAPCAIVSRENRHSCGTLS